MCKHTLGDGNMMNYPIKTCLAPRYTLYMLSIFSDKSTIQEQHRLSVFYHQKCRSAGNFGSNSLCSKDNLPEFACFVSTATTYFEIVNKVTSFQEII